MRIAILLIFALMTITMDVSAQETQGKEGFPGVGSIEQWQSSKPEFQAGLADMKTKQYQRAIEHFNAAIALYPYEHKYFFHLGRAIEASGGKLEDAEAAYRKALSLKSDDWKAWHRLSSVLYVQKKYSEARDAVGSALQLDVPPKDKLKLETELKTITSMMNGGRDLDVQPLSDIDESD